MKSIQKTKCLMLEYSPYLMNLQNEEKESFLINLTRNFSIIWEVTEKGLQETNVEAILGRADQFDLIFEK